MLTKLYIYIYIYINASRSLQNNRNVLCEPKPAEQHKCFMRAEACNTYMCVCLYTYVLMRAEACSTYMCVYIYIDIHLYICIDASRSLQNNKNVLCEPKPAVHICVYIYIDIYICIYISIHMY